MTSPAAGLWAPTRWEAVVPEPLQLTWDDNYRTYGNVIGQPLYDEPDLALEADIAAAVFAEFFGRSGAAEAAQKCDWALCRKRVQGADAGLEELITVVRCLGMP